MTPIEFCYWLQGWVEMERGKKPNLEQWKLITAHLRLVFDKVTPTMEELSNGGYPTEPEPDSVEDEMERAIQDAITGLCNADAQIVFNPPSGSRPPQTSLHDLPLICSDEQNINDKQFCTTAGRSLLEEDESQYKVRVPRQMRND